MASNSALQSILGRSVPWNQYSLLLMIPRFQNSSENLQCTRFKNGNLCFKLTSISCSSVPAGFLRPNTLAKRAIFAELPYEPKGQRVHCDTDAVPACGKFESIRAVDPFDGYKPTYTSN